MDDLNGSMGLPGVGSEVVTTTYDWEANIGGTEVMGAGTESTRVTYDSSVGDTATYDTTITAYDAIGTGGGHSYELQADGPQLTTQETVTSLGGGVFHIHSFFDIFTELSLDHGSFIPADPSYGNSRGQIQLTPSATPEPVTMGLLAVGLGFAAARRRRR
jgi:hypothetical protein